MELPPGQRARRDFPRFGLGKFALRFPATPERIRVRIAGDVERELIVEDRLATLPRVDQTSDFHCVTTWSALEQNWSGWRFSDVYDQLVCRESVPLSGAEVVVFRGEDGYCSCLMLDDLLKPDVMLADRLNGQSLGLEHGAPLRLVAPAHYGYKNVKHLVAIEFWRDRRAYRFPFPYPALMDHPRARVAFEERGRWIPGAILRRLYRLIVPFTVWNFARALEAHRRSQSTSSR
ncbi:molybdopterin-dependent oxidoreductase [Nevskia sp.]|uniref:molybdopterin-dependent oxidoreductase n=1 Tax=Nevskia sp. TaxID=1929292 RepID=UPI0025EF3C21|nr:molybdopterin-dependent oxidoreductase [Nevskia sp.]